MVGPDPIEIASELEDDEERAIPRSALSDFNGASAAYPSIGSPGRRARIRTLLISVPVAINTNAPMTRGVCPLEASESGLERIHHRRLKRSKPSHVLDCQTIWAAEFSEVTEATPRPFRT